MADFEKKIEKIKIPNIEVPLHQKEFRTVLLNTKKTAWLGSILIVFPLLFLLGLFFKDHLNLDLKIITFIYDWISAQDRMYQNTSLLNWIIRLFFILGPILAIIINLLAITHLRYEKNMNEVVLSVKIRWFNLSIITLCFGIIFVLFNYLVSLP